MTTDSKIKNINGRVVSTKMDKTITVLVERLVKHPRYKKYIKKSTKLMAHDEENICVEGDLVSIAPSRPYSKNKTWVFVDKLTNKQ
jgi:small subunit ribosomal protein S17